MYGDGVIKKIIKNTGIVIFWVAFALAVLFSPRIFKRFRRKNSINILLWSAIIDPKLFDQFEKETGIRVNYGHYEGNEELLVKLLATGGKGYDMVVPSDYIVHFLVKHNLLKKIDKSKLDFYDKLNPVFMNHFFDPHNNFSIPSEWYILGLGFNKEFFPKGVPEASWDIILNPEKMPEHIIVINDSRELITLALWHKYGTVRPLNKKEILEIKDILREQKKHIEAYSDFRGDFLLESGNCSVAIIPNSFGWKTAIDNSDIVFEIPKEGTFFSIENYVIPAVSKKADMVYKLMNFLFRPENQKHNFKLDTSSFLSTRIDADYMFNDIHFKSSREYIDPKSNKRPMLFHNVLTDEQVDEIWLSVKGE